MTGLGTALGFLTVVPVRADGAAADTGEAWLSRSAVWFPVVGALVGGVAGGVVVLGDAAGVPMGVAGGLGLVAAIALTRGLHEDGLADTADGLGVHGSRERRLAAMKDSAVGAHGALAMACALVLEALALAGLDAGGALRALVAAHLLARGAMIGAAALLPPARRDGLGAGLAVSRTAAVISGAVSAVGAVAIAGIEDGAVVLASSLAVLAVAVVLQARAFGGRTGDTLGATGKLVEVAALVALAGAWS